MYKTEFVAMATEDSDGLTSCLFKSKIKIRLFYSFQIFRLEQYIRKKGSGKYKNIKFKYKVGRKICNLSKYPCNISSQTSYNVAMKCKTPLKPSLS